MLYNSQVPPNHFKNNPIAQEKDETPCISPSSNKNSPCYIFVIAEQHVMPCYIGPNYNSSQFFLKLSKNIDIYQQYKFSTSKAG